MAKTTPLRTVFGTHETLSRLQDHAARLIRLQRIVDQVMPRNLRGLAAVANLQDGVLTLHVPGPALAQRLTLIQESLLNDLHAQGEAVTALKVRVRAIQSAPPDTSVCSEPRIIGEDAVQALRALQDKLAEADEQSPLSQALGRILKNTKHL